MKLCLNVDDFGMSPQINAGILKAAQAGPLKSCSAFAGLATAEDLAKLKALPEFSVGLHFSLTTAGTQEKGWSRPSQLMLATLVGPLSEELIEQSLRSQYEKLERDWGKKLSHLDTHQHIHILPKIKRVMKRFAAEKNIPLVRYPYEESFKLSWRKLLFNAAFFKERCEIAFWGPSFMGEEFNLANLERQFHYLKQKGVERSHCMVHFGEYSPQLDDDYNQQRVIELERFMRFKEWFEARFEMVSMEGLL